MTKHYIKMIDSICGPINLTSDGKYLTGLWFANSADDKKFKQDYEEKDLEIFNETQKWLNIYFNGDNPNFTPPYKLDNLTQFQKMVTDIVLEIPYGEVITYKDIAMQIAKQKQISKMSAQAVGHAVGFNPICLIIPCHRVIGQNNNLTGYGGGIDNKIKLLAIEHHDIRKFKKPKEGNNAKM